MLQESEQVRPASAFAFPVPVLRRRLARTAAVGATAVSAAAVAAFAVGLQGSGLSLFSSTGSRVSAAPCLSCLKKRVVTSLVPSSAAPPGPIHVVNPLVSPEATAAKP